MSRRRHTRWPRDWSSDVCSSDLLKAKLYWKNYLFERATFVKAGLVGHFSPQAYHAAEYLPELNRWQYGTQSFLNPSHTRLDAEVSEIGRASCRKASRSR